VDPLWRRPESSISGAVLLDPDGHKLEIVAAL
jgi:hypothetical protein